jgi:hypothetical protein
MFQDQMLLDQMSFSALAGPPVHSRRIALAPSNSLLGLEFDVGVLGRRLPGLIVRVQHRG